MGHSDGRIRRSVCRNIQEPLVIASSRFVDPLSDTLASEFPGKEPLRVISCLFPSHNKVCMHQLLHTCSASRKWDSIRMSLQWCWVGPCPVRKNHCIPCYRSWNVVDGTVISSSLKQLPQSMHSSFFPITTTYTQNHHFVYMYMYLVLFPVLWLGKGLGTRL